MSPSPIVSLRQFCDEHEVVYRLWVALEWHGDGDVESALGVIRDLAHEFEYALREDEIAAGAREAA